MSKTTDFIINNPGKNFDGTDDLFEAVAHQWQGMTKADIQKAAGDAVDMFLTVGDVLNAAERLAAMEAFIDAIKKDKRYKDYMQDELAKHKGKYTTRSGARIETMEGGVKYDYSKDHVWSLLNTEVVNATERRKQREELLKKIPEGKTLIDEETGEVTAAGPLKSSTTTYKVTLAAKETVKDIDNPLPF